MLSKSALQQLMTQFDDIAAFHGLVLHGSFAKDTEDAVSDIDLICVKRIDTQERNRSSFLGRSVDLYLSSPGLIRRSFAQPTPTNNNVVLNAFINGHILADRDGVVSRLADEAKEIWQKQPPQLPPARQAERISLLMKGLERSKRFAMRADMAAPGREIARILADRVFREAITVYCKVNRRWASHLPETLEWLRRDDPGFYRLCEEYLLSASFAERVARLESIIDTIIQTKAGVLPATFPDHS